MRFLKSLSVLSLASFTTALTSSLQSVTKFTTGPTAAKMYIYVPTSVVSPAPIIVAVHFCTGTGPIYFSNTQYATLADTHGFIVIYPSAPASCWDVASNTTLTHGAGGDSLTIVNMVSYAIANYGGDKSKVYVTGSSSGAMMTNVLAGSYPNVFAARSVYSGVPDGCFYVAGATAGASTPGWNSKCSTGFEVNSAEEWGALVQSYFPSYSGTYPRMQLYVSPFSFLYLAFLSHIADCLANNSFHGTSDTTLRYANLAEELKEWSNLLDVSFTSNTTNTPSSGYTKMVYGDGTKLVAYSALGVGHTVPVHEELDLGWFGIA